jgi:hypothetical protein
MLKYNFSLAAFSNHSYSYDKIPLMREDLFDTLL